MKINLRLLLALAAAALGILAVTTPSWSARQGGPWYIAPGGDDSNGCSSPAAACATIAEVLNQPGFTAQDTILVAEGIYTGTGVQVVLLDKSVVLSGGWNVDFTSQSGQSTLEGEASRRGITVNRGITVTVERFTIQNGVAEEGGGIINLGALTLSETTLISNTAVTSCGGGIYNSGGCLTVNSSAIISNVSQTGGGLCSISGTVILSDSAVSGNLAKNNYYISQYGIPVGGGIYSERDQITLFRAEVSGNQTYNCCLSGWEVARGGGIGLTGSTMTVTSSGINANWGNYGGGIHCNNCRLVINTSTLSHNESEYGGAIFNTGDVITVSSSTIAYNYGYHVGGISGNAALQNSIFFNNITECPGFVSLGYNLVTPASSCGYVPGPGDLTDLDPTLRPLQGFPGYHALPLSSFAIDKGNPAGCTDSLGNLLDSDQRGVPRAGRCDIGAFEFPAIVSRAFMPQVIQYYCPDWMDDFSNPASGWPVGEDDFVRAEYLNGEYRILSKREGYLYLFRAPNCVRENYVVQADSRWANASGDGYGVLFGITANFGQYYLFYVSADYEEYALLRRDPGRFTVIVPFRSAWAIHRGAAANHLKVTRKASEITLEVNGTVLGTWNDSTITGRTGVGLFSNRYSDGPTSDARFDNFSVIRLPDSLADATTTYGNALDESNTMSMQRVPALEWRQMR